MPDFIVRLIERVYTGILAIEVPTADRCTEIFNILVRVLQADSLTVIVIDYMHIINVSIHDNETEIGRCGVCI